MSSRRIPDLKELPCRLNPSSGKEYLLTYFDGHDGIQEVILDASGRRIESRHCWFVGGKQEQRSLCIQEFMAFAPPHD